MLNTVGLTAQRDYLFWLEAVRNCKPKHMTSAPFGGAVPAMRAHTWVAVPDKSVDLVKCAAWLRMLEAPLVLITQHIKAALGLARAVPYLACICHPLQAEYELRDLLYIASQRTSGICIVDASRQWREALRSVR